MDVNGNGKKMHPGWLTLMIFILVQAIMVSGFAWTNNTKTNRNEKDIEKNAQSLKELTEKIYLELTQIRQEINK